MKEFFQKLADFLTAPTTVMSILRFVFAIVVLFVGCKLVKVFTKKIVKGRAFARFNTSVRTFLGHMVSFVLYVLVVVLASFILGIELAGFSAFIIAIGITVGLALQGSFTNIVGGIMIVGAKPFEVGNYIEGNGVSGTVTNIGLFYTTVTTPDNNKVVVPNGALSNSTVTNYSANDVRRLELDFTVSYSADIALCKKVLYSCAKVDERVIQDPVPSVVLTAHADKGLVLQLRAWVRNEDYSSVKYSLLEQVKVNFDQFGIALPNPQLDVHLPR